MKQHKGFTLIEVLIVVSIVGLLAATVLVGLGGFRERGRDARRISDLKSLQNGIELFYTKNNAYPATLNDLLGPAAGIGINKIPSDPVSGSYLYSVFSADKQSYIVAAKLDAKPDDLIFNDSYQGSVTGYSGTVTTCDKAQQIYCVQF